MKGRFRLRAAAVALAIGTVLGIARGAMPAAAQGAEASYEDRLMRLAEILGAIHHLRDICGANEGQIWRDQMLAMLEAEDPPGQFRGRLIAAFNNGYGGYQRTYGSCTPSAKTAAERFFSEGSEIATSLALVLAVPDEDEAETEEDAPAAEDTEAGEAAADEAD